MSSFSITIRFRVFNQQIKDTFSHYCIGDTNGYCYSYEKGSSLDFNHIQGFIQFNKDLRPDSVKRSLLRRYKKFMTIDKNEEKHSIIVKTCSDKDYVIGYTLKENYEYYTNFDIDYINSCKELYVNKKSDKLKTIKVSKNNIVYIIRSYMSLKQIEKDFYIPSDITNVIGQMSNEYYEFCWIGKRNINDIVDYLTNVLNGTCEEYFKNIYEDSKYSM